MKKQAITGIVLPILLVFSCASGQRNEMNTPAVDSSSTASPAQTQNTTQTTQKDPQKTDQEAVVAQFDSVPITKQTFETTKSEMQLVVEQLNKITYTRNYDAWLPWLSKEYYDTYSDPAVLDTVSASLPTKGIKLKTLRDYFNYVFVPSRQNMRVDDIKFVSPTRVYVIMEILPGQPAAIYILEKTSAGWKLVTKNQ